MKSGLDKTIPSLVDTTSIAGRRLVKMEMLNEVAFALSAIGGKLWSLGYPDFQKHMRKGINYVVQIGKYKGTKIVKVGKVGGISDEAFDDRMKQYVREDKKAGSEVPKVYIRDKAHVDDTSKGEELLKGSFGIWIKDKEGKRVCINNVDGDNELFDMSKFPDSPDIVKDEEGNIDDEAFLEWLAEKFVSSIDSHIVDDFCHWYGDDYIYPKKLRDGDYEFD